LSPVQRMYCAKDALGVGAEEELCSLLCDSEAEIDEEEDDEETDEEDDEELSGTKDERLSSLSDVRLSSVSGRCEEYGEELPEFCGLFVISLQAYATATGDSSRAAKKSAASVFFGFIICVSPVMRFVP